MKLHSSPASPFVRKVLVSAHELGIAQTLDVVTVTLSPINPNEELNRQNPLGKIPALELDNSTTLYDSRVICEYLDSQSATKKMFPADGPARWTALQRQSLGDGIMDAGVLARYETFLRPEDKKWPEWGEGQRGKFLRAVEQLETEVSALGDTVDIGTIAIACALGYLDFRYDDLNWRGNHPQLGAWFDSFNQRPSMQITMPV